MRSDVEEALAKFDIITWFGEKRKIEEAEVVLKDDETVLLVATTNFTIFYGASRSKPIPAVFFLTDSRIIFYSDTSSAFSNKSKLDIMLLSEIHSVDYRATAGRAHYVNIYTLTKSFNFAILGRKINIDSIRQVFENAINNYKSQQSTQSPQSNNSQPDIIEQIEKLSILKDKGIITEEEFRTKKADLLARL